jgi:hypothetical protein
MWQLNSGQGCFGYAVPCFPGTVCGVTNPACSLKLLQVISCVRQFLFPFRLLRVAFMYFLVPCEHWHQSRFVLENLQSVFFTPVVYGLECGLHFLRISGREGPCVMIIISSAKTTILTFASLECSVNRSLIMIFHKVGLDTDPWGP